MRIWLGHPIKRPVQSDCQHAIPQFIHMGTSEFSQQLWRHPTLDYNSDLIVRNKVNLNHHWDRKLIHLDTHHCMNFYYTDSRQLLHLLPNDLSRIFLILFNWLLNGHFWLKIQNATRNLNMD